MNKMSFYDFLIKIQSIAKIGLEFSKDDYALENYKEINELTRTMLEQFIEVNFDRPNYFERHVYPTPNVSVRTVIFNDKNEVLMVQEKQDLKYSLPGGWADLYESPKEAAIKECLQEAGAVVTIERLTGVFNRTPFKNPASVPEYAFIFKGHLQSISDKHQHETVNVQFFPLDQLPPLSPKVTKEEVLRAIHSALKEGIEVD
jgi:8-oxo-dGTP diphosphatase